ncbi:MAG: endopeptidase La [Ruminococcus sp.]|nr:endopeptidase La [Ruminococcus sp.]
MSERIVIKDNKNPILPCVPTRELVVFPGMVLHFDVGREMSINALKAALASDGYVFLVAQKDVVVEKPIKSDMYKIGTIAKVTQIIKSPNGLFRCLVEGAYKGRLVDFYVHGKNYEAEVKKMPNYSREKFDENEIYAVCREIKDIFGEYAKVVPRMPNELYTQVIAANEPKNLFEAIAFNITLPFADRQILLETGSAGEKLACLMSILSREIDVISLEQQIHEQVRASIEDNQREFYIREQIKALQNELGNMTGEESGDDNEIQSYLDKIEATGACDEVKEKLTSEVKRLSKMMSSSQEAVVIRNYLDTCLALPWNVYTKDRTDIKKAEKILENDHYGMKRVKERILENLAVRCLTPEIKGQILCLYGPPGVGKTSVGKSIARALNRKYVRVSLGGIKDESDIRGHRKTYVGAMEGRIINAIKQAGVKNPVVLLDEIDKMSNDFRGDPSSAMLEVLDSEQNSSFRDHYIEMPFDLSDVMFVTTANNLDTIQPPLLDRMEVIELSSYTREEKFNIAKLHLIPKQLKKNGLKASQMRITNDGIYMLIDSYTREAGVRKLERAIGSLCRKAAKEIVEDNVKKVTFRASNIEKYLGHKKYLPEYTSKEDQVGCVNGMAWTSVGGVLMPLEVLVLDGKGKIELTGSLGDVMKESAKIAVSYCRSVADKYGIAHDFYETKDLHIHAPEGAVPKDGPSAGVTMVTALVSALSGIPVRADVAMTGEITLSGRVLPIGGLREKTMAAYKEGIKTVVVPKANIGDLDEIDDVVKLNLEFVFAETIQDVLDVSLTKKPDESSIPVGVMQNAVKGDIRTEVTV